jgi:hypothetical protein
MLSRYLVGLLATALAVSAIPQPMPAQTPSPSSATASSGSSTSLTTPPSSIITPAATLTCTNGSTVTTTTDCTRGNTYSYCYSPPPPIQCASGYFPGTWHPERCGTEQTCYALDSPWLTTSCSNGQIPYSTSTLYVGTLSGGESTTVSSTLDLFQKISIFFSFSQNFFPSNNLYSGRMLLRHRPMVQHEPRPRRFLRRHLLHAPYQLPGRDDDLDQHQHLLRDGAARVVLGNPTHDRFLSMRDSYTDGCLPIWRWRGGNRVCLREIDIKYRITIDRHNRGKGNWGFTLGQTNFCFAFRNR